MRVGNWHSDLDLSEIDCLVCGNFGFVFGTGEGGDDNDDEWTDQGYGLLADKHRRVKESTYHEIKGDQRAALASNGHIFPRHRWRFIRYWKAVMMNNCYPSFDF